MTKSVNVGIGDGGRVKLLNDPGETHTVTYAPRPLKNWERKEIEMNNRARNFFSVSSREAALEQLLWNQITQHE